jgi:ELWxxDGT repeat protein
MKLIPSILVLTLCISGFAQLNVNTNEIVNKRPQKNSSVQSVLSISSTTQVSLCQPYDLKSIGPGAFCNINGMIIINSGGLWKSDGTTVGTIKINAAPSNIQGSFAILGNAAYFISGTQIWKTDGTELGTVMVSDITNAKSFGSLVASGNLVYFLVSFSTTTIYKLWKTDGTAAGTSLVKDIDPSNSNSWDPRNLFAYNNNVYFKAGNI